MNTRKKRTLAAAGAVALALGTFGGLTPTKADAAPYRVGYSVTYGGNTKTVGTLNVRPGSNGNRVICVDSNVGDASSLPAPSQITTNGRELNAYQIAYLVDKYVNTLNNDDGAAVAELIKMSLDKSDGARAAIWNAFVSQRPTEAARVQARMDQMRAEAAANAGPYTVPVDIQSTNAAGTVGTVDVGVQSGNGTWMAGYSMNITLSGPGVFDSTGTNTMTVTSTSGAPVSVAWHRSPMSPDAVLASATVTGLNSNVYLYYVPGGGDQDMVSKASLTTDASGDDPEGVILTSMGVSFASHVSTVGVKTGDAIPTDTVDVSLSIPTADTITVKNTVYGPFLEQPTAGTIPAGAAVVETMSQSVTTDATGKATVTFTPTKTSPGVGYYVYVASVDAQTSTNGLTVNPSSSPANDAKEGFITPDVKASTKISSQEVFSGATLSDTATASGTFVYSGGVEALNTTISGKLLGPVAPINGKCSGLDWTGAPTAATIPSTPVSGPGDITGLGTYTVPDKASALGCYTYTEDVTVATAGGKILATYHHAAGDVSQTALVKPKNPKVDSIVGQAAFGPKGALVDNVSATDGTPDYPVIVKGTVYGPLAELPATVTPTPPAGTPVFDTVQADAVVAADGTVKATLTSTKIPTEGGYYIWVEEVLDKSTGAVMTTSTYGRLKETSMVYPEGSVSTKVSTQLVIPNTKISDTATVTGVKQFEGGIEPVTTTLSGSLLGPVAPAADGTCTAVDWTGAPVAAEIPEQVVTKDGDITGLGEYDVVKLGCYTYTEKLVAKSGDKVLWTYEHKPGDVAQTTLSTLPKISTQANVIIGTKDTELFDTIKVTDTTGAKGTMTAKLYGAVAPLAGQQCDSITDQMWRDGIKAGTVKEVYSEDIAIDGDGTYVTKKTKALENGCHTWYESAKFDEHPDASVETPYGVKTETTLIVTPKITTLAAQNGAYVGSSFSDSIFLEGTYSAPGTITGKILGPIAPGANNSCLNLNWDSAPVAAEIAPLETKGDGTYVTSPFKVKAEGCYTFVETWTAKDSNTVVTNTKPGEASETLFFANVPVPTGFAGIDSMALMGLATLGGVIGAGAAFRSRRRETV